MNGQDHERRSYRRERGWEIHLHWRNCSPDTSRFCLGIHRKDTSSWGDEDTPNNDTIEPPTLQQTTRYASPKTNKETAEARENTVPLSIRRDTVFSISFSSTKYKYQRLYSDHLQFSLLNSHPSCYIHCLFLISHGLISEPAGLISKPGGLISK